MGLYQTKNFCTAKENISKTKRQPTEWENIFNGTCDKGFISKIYKELKRTQHQNTIRNPIKNGQRA